MRAANIKMKVLLADEGAYSMGSLPREVLEAYPELGESRVFGVDLGSLGKYCPRAGVCDLPSKIARGVGTPGSMGDNRRVNRVTNVRGVERAVV